MPRRLWRPNGQCAQTRVLESRWTLADQRVSPSSLVLSANIAQAMHAAMTSATLLDGFRWTQLPALSRPSPRRPLRQAFFCKCARFLFGFATLGTPYRLRGIESHRLSRNAFAPDLTHPAVMFPHYQHILRKTCGHAGLRFFRH